MHNRCSSSLNVYFAHGRRSRSVLLCASASVLYKSKCVNILRVCIWMNKPEIFIVIGDKQVDTMTPKFFERPDEECGIHVYVAQVCKIFSL